MKPGYKLGDMSGEALVEREKVLSNKAWVEHEGKALPNDA